MGAENGVNKYRAHVLALPFPAQGHMNPMMEFCKRLVSKGVKVTFAVTTFLSKSMHADPQSSIKMETISDGFDSGGFAEAETVDAYQKKFQEVGPRTLADLIKKLQNLGHPVHAILYDSLLVWALDVAKHFGIMKVVFFTQTCAVNSVYYHAYKNHLKLPLSDPYVSLPSLPRLEPSDLPSFLYHSGSYPVFYDMLVYQFRNIDDADFLLFNIFYDMEKEAVDWMKKKWNVKTVGPTVPSMYLDKRLHDDKSYGLNLFEPKISACITWLNDKPSNSVVYVSVGSLAQLDSEQMEELAWGLKRSNYYFLWVVRESEMEKLPKKLREETISEKALIVTWCPQLDVLAHDSVGCFVTHCGFNSVLEAMSIGVPLVAMPIWTDQPTNGKYVEDVWGNGIRARQENGNGKVRREVIERCIKEVMEGDKSKEIRKNAIKWKDLAKQAVDKGGSSDKNVDEFVATLVRFSSN